MKKFYLLFLGIIFFFVFIEISLRFSGYLYYKLWMKKEAVRIEEEEFELLLVEDRAKVQPEDKKLVKILCLGDSWTFGQGASPGYSYPAQLQTILDKERSNKYRVYNAGIPGCTLTQLLKYLPKFSKKYRPDIVLILIGKNDINNPRLSELILTSGWPRSYYFKLMNVISDLRVYKIFKYILDGFKQKNKFSKIIKKDTEDINPESDEYYHKGYDLGDAGEFELAEEYFKKAIEIDPNNEVAYLHFGHLFQSKKEYSEALNIYRKLIKMNLYTSFREELYRYLLFMYQTTDEVTRKEIIALIKDLPSDEKFRNPGLPFLLNKENAIKNLNCNLLKAITLIRSMGAVPVIQTYDPSHLTYGILKDITKRYNVLFVDNTKIFEKLFESKSYFAADGHPNEKGYRLIAENVYNTLKKINEK